MRRVKEPFHAEHGGTAVPAELKTDALPATCTNPAYSPISKAQFTLDLQASRHPARGVRCW